MSLVVSATLIDNIRRLLFLLVDEPRAVRRLGKRRPGEGRSGQEVSRRLVARRADRSVSLSQHLSHCVSGEAGRRRVVARRSVHDAARSLRQDDVGVAQVHVRESGQDCAQELRTVSGQDGPQHGALHSRRQVSKVGRRDARRGNVGHGLWHG